MFERRSFKWPITLGVTMIVLLVALTVGWIILALSGVLQDRGSAAVYWSLLTVGTTCLVLVTVGVVLYLSLSIKEISLNRRQSNFMDSVTHELKSPIASLKLYLQTLNRRQVSPAEQQDFCRFMLEDVERLDHLINHLLGAARIDRQPVDAEQEDIQLDTTIAQCANDIASRYEGSSLLLDLQPAVVRARRIDMDMIIRNLIDNAFKYGGEPASVTVSCMVKEAEVCVQVTDNGDGIPHRYRSKIFGRFVRLGVELERKKPGTGLGLYIVQTLVRRLKGRIRIKDREPGPGTVFEVQLPGRPADAAVSPSPPLESERGVEVA